jgi:hypothetical protein
MKKFLIILLLLVFAFGVVYYFLFYADSYLPLLHRGEETVPYRTEGKALTMGRGNDYFPLTLRGVELSPAKPGAQQTAYALTEEDYLRYLTQIGEMGANCVQVVSVMDVDFYNALFQYNTEAEEPILLIQGFSVSDRVNNDPRNAFESGLQKKLIQNGKEAVDIIHGRKNLPFSESGGTGNYRKDVSPWVVAYLVDVDWIEDTVAYTDHSGANSREFHGTYFETCPESTNFEALLAAVMDQVISYETGKYRNQRPIGFLSDPSCDFLTYKESIALQLTKYATLNAEHILPTENSQAGLFAAYRLYDINTDFRTSLTEDLTEELMPFLAELDTTAVYGGYCQLIAEYHTIPVVGFFTFPSSRVSTTDGLPPLTEREQGERLALSARTLEELEWAGGIVAGWQDNWTRSSWNTSFAMDFDTNHLWHDLNTDGQNSGLLAYMPGKESVCVLDGDQKEWIDELPILEENGLRVFCRYDQEALYFLVEGIIPEETVYLPLDTCTEVGSKNSEHPALCFSQDVDFILCLSGKAESCLLVQERYDSLRERFQFDIDKTNPFVDVPDKSSGTFLVVRTAVDSDTLLTELTQQSEAIQTIKIFEAGRLVHGNGDPESPNYNSLADFCYGSDCVEIRLPWLLLNVGDPSTMEVHGDYYKRYGVELIPVREFWIGATRGGDEECAMAPLALRGTGSRVVYRERLKQSYYIMQALWKGGGSGDIAG